MKSRVIKAIFIFIAIVLVYFLFTLFYSSPKDVENINKETSLEESSPENTTSDTNNNSFFSEEEKEAKLQACIIALLGPERILELESGNGKITPAVEAKIKECEEKINKGEF